MVQAEEPHELPDAMGTMGLTNNFLRSDPGSEEVRPDSRMNTHTGRLIDGKSSMDAPEDANQIELQRHIIAKTKTDKVNPLAKKNQFESVGTNGFFTALPGVIKFAGFETNKTHTMKLRILNNSPAP
jgi:hypothetical protein